MQQENLIQIDGKGGCGDNTLYLKSSQSILRAETGSCPTISIRLRMQFGFWAIPAYDAQGMSGWISTAVGSQGY
jgi:hypothetical protein